MVQEPRKARRGRRMRESINISEAALQEALPDEGKEDARQSGRRQKVKAEGEGEGDENAPASCSAIPAPPVETKPNGVWSNDSIFCLLDLYILLLRSTGNPNYVKRSEWETLTDKLNTSESTNISVRQVRDKVDALTRRYLRESKKLESEEVTEPWKYYDRVGDMVQLKKREVSAVTQQQALHDSLPHDASQSVQHRNSLGHTPTIDRGKSIEGSVDGDTGLAHARVDHAAVHAQGGLHNARSHAHNNVQSYGKEKMHVDADDDVEDEDEVHAQDGLHNARSQAHHNVQSYGKEQMQVDFYDDVEDEDEVHAQGGLHNARSQAHHNVQSYGKEKMHVDPDANVEDEDEVHTQGGLHNARSQAHHNVQSYGKEKMHVDFADDVEDEDEVHAQGGLHNARSQAHHSVQSYGKEKMHVDSNDDVEDEDEVHAQGRLHNARSQARHNVQSYGKEKMHVDFDDDDDVEDEDGDDEHEDVEEEDFEDSSDGDDLASQRASRRRKAKNSVVEILQSFAQDYVEVEDKKWQLNKELSNSLIGLIQTLLKKRSRK